MSTWSSKPFLYQINTWVWLNTLSRKYGQPITLGNVPDAELNHLAQLNVDAVWLMGIWQRSTAARKSALNYKHEYKSALPDLTDDDVIGSAYAIYAYEVDSHLGGRAALAALRQRLLERGLRLILDFVPNHTAVDAQWTVEHPSYYVQGTPRDLKKRKDVFFEARDAWERSAVLAHGRDPYFPAWIDTAQLNAYDASYRQQAAVTLQDIASQCDGVRCDMAMLMLNSIFEQTWIGHVDEAPLTEFWAEVISRVNAEHPDFLFIAECYWGLEHTLQQQGFDYTYDKTLYDRIGEGQIDKIYDHLTAMLDFQKRAVHFIENHDEPRANSSFGTAKSKAAAALICTVPGMVLLHDGQFEGFKVKMPVQLARKPDETADEELRSYYTHLLAETCESIYRDGSWTLFDGSDKRLLAYGWSQNGDSRLIIVNLTSEAAAGVVNLGAWDYLHEHSWTLRNIFSEGTITWSGDELVKSGLPVELPPYTAHIYHVKRV
ncbi:MAG: alpha-amylase family glycosyl hydrolase [Anaerolineae bacterium]